MICYFFSVYVLLMKRLSRNVHMYYGFFLSKKNDEWSVLLPLNKTSVQMSLKVISSGNV